ncbi:hypothetical protein J2T19_003503 [Paenibacillus tundrae]|uniref:Uncharacterized protein n=1 Tax=Paenibacillus tundrae TaxID=528187 RepID=A0ABT9WFK2_9BACL|nr:hypothetical protein [Paenibacillus tundrae]
MLTILIMDTYLPYLLKYCDILNGYLSSTVTMKKPEQVRGADIPTQCGRLQLQINMDNVAY